VRTGTLRGNRLCLYENFHGVTAKYRPKSSAYWATDMGEGNGRRREEIVLN
jgi:hypothetical protein